MKNIIQNILIASLLSTTAFAMGPELEKAAAGAATRTASKKRKIPVDTAGKTDTVAVGLPEISSSSLEKRKRKEEAAVNQAPFYIPDDLLPILEAQGLGILCCHKRDSDLPKGLEMSDLMTRAKNAKLASDTELSERKIFLYPAMISSALELWNTVLISHFSSFDDSKGKILTKEELMLRTRLESVSDDAYARYLYLHPTKIDVTTASEFETSMQVSSVSTSQSKVGSSNCTIM